MDACGRPTGTGRKRGLWRYWLPHREKDHDRELDPLPEITPLR
jgi:hypothetical protein